jgi:autotransporter-associated beta strand protein
MLKTATSTISASRIIGVLPVLNGGTGVTTKTGTGNVVLSAAPTLSGDVSLSTGNLIPSTAAKGIDFTANTPAAGVTSQLLNKYEEGVITIAATCDTGTITLTLNSLYYTRTGRVVAVNGKLTVASVSSPTGNVSFGLPIQAGTNSTMALYLSGTNAIAGEIPIGLINAGQSIFYIQKLNQASGAISGAASIFKAGTVLQFQAIYTA